MTNYYFANSELVAKKANDGNKVYFHNDHLGSNSITTNQAGAQVEQVTYDPWGQVLGAATQSKFLYTGQEHDGETGLHYYDARYYDSELRRFTQPDTIIQDVYDPQSLNRYSYARNNPLRYTDPTGHAWWDAIVNTVKSVVNTISSWIAPKAPAVASKLPLAAIPYRGPIITPRSGGGSNNSGGGSSSGGGGGNSGGSSGNGNITNTHVGPDPRFANAYKYGHVSQSVSLGPVSLGRQINKYGNAPTFSLGADLGLPVGFSQTYSNKPINQNSISLNGNSNTASATQIDIIDTLTKLNTPLEWDFEDGEGCCSVVGIDLEITGAFAVWAPPVSQPIESIYKSSFEKVNNR